jgi:predicted HicB family RNase H-like nuclease
MLDVLTFWCYSDITTPGGNPMAPQTKRATVYLEPDLHKALRLKAAETSRSISEIVNNAIREALAEDAEDIAAFEERVGEPLISYDEMVKRLKRDGRI